MGQTLAGGWRPRHWGDGDLSIALDNPGVWLLKGVVFERKLAELRNWALSDTSPVLEGVDRDALIRTLDALAAEIPSLEGELAGITRFGMDFRFNEERFGMAMRLLSNPDTLMGKIGAAAAGRGAVDGDLVRRISDDAVQIMCIAPIEEMLPGISSSLPVWSERFFGQALPDHKDAVVAALRDSLATGPGKQSGGGYLRGDIIAAVAWTEVKNPSAMMAAQKNLARVTGGVFKALYPGYSEGDAVTMTEAVTPGGLAYVKIDWDEEFMRRFSEFCSAFFSCAFGAPPSVATAPVTPNDISVMLAGDKNHVVTVGGALGPDGLDAVMKDAPADRPLRDIPSAKAALDDMKYRQNIYLLTNFGTMIKSMVMNSAGNRLSREEVEKRFKALEPQLRKSDELVGMAFGSDDSGAVVADMFIPTDAIGMFIHNFTLIQRNMPLSGPPARFAKAALTANEKTAESALKAYATAQITFQIGKQGRVAANTGAGDKGYADNFRNLYYGEVVGMADMDQTLQLISKRVADAFAGPTGGMPAVAKAEPAQEPEPYNGYLFLEPPGLDYTRDFALVAYPAEFGVTGNRILWIDSEGIIYSMILSDREGGLPARGEMPALLTPEETRFANEDLWEVAE